MSVSETTPERRGDSSKFLDNSNITKKRTKTALGRILEINDEELLLPPHRTLYVSPPPPRVRKRQDNFVLASFRLIKTDGKL